MHALFLASLGGGDGTLDVAFFFDFTGDETGAASEVLPFFADVFNEPATGAAMPLLLRFFFAEDLGASDEVDMSRSGSWNSSPTATWWSFLLHFLFLAVPLAVFATLGVAAPFASGAAESLSLVSNADQEVREINVYILITTSPTLNVTVNGIMLVYYVDGFALNRELDMNGASTIVGWCEIFAGCGSITVILCVGLFLFLVGFPVFVLHAVLADIVQSGTITTSLWVVSVALRVLEPICLLNSRYNRPDVG